MSITNYLKSINKMNDLVQNKKIKDDEIKKYSESDIYWANNKSKSIKSKNLKLKKGEVLQIEFGKNFEPELAYEHRGLILGINQKLIYVLPICSYNSNNPQHVNAYHPIDNNNDINNNFYLLKASEYNFIKHDSVLKLNDLRTISVLRIKYKYKDCYIDSNTDTFKEITKMCFKKYFPTISYDYDKLKEENDKLKDKILELENKINLLNKDIENGKSKEVAIAQDNEK